MHFINFEVWCWSFKIRKLYIKIAGNSLIMTSTNYSTQHVRWHNAVLHLPRVCKVPHYSFDVNFSAVNSTVEYGVRGEGAEGHLRGWGGMGLSLPCDRSQHESVKCILFLSLSLTFCSLAEAAIWGWGIDGHVRNVQLSLFWHFLSTFSIPCYEFSPSLVLPMIYFSDNLRHFSVLRTVSLRDHFYVIT